MAVEISPSVRRTFDLRHQPVNNLLVKAAPARDAYRRLARVVRKPNGARPATAQIPETLEATADQFQRDGWAFVDPFFDDQFHAELVAGWPPRVYFGAMRNIEKSYDFGFKWLRGKPGEPEGIEAFPVLKAAYDLFRSDEMSQRITDYWADGLERSCYSMTVSWATGGSALIPHRDGIVIEDDPLGNSFMNFVVFVDGTGGHQAGGTCIVEDNEYKNVIFEPENLRNTALAYKSTAPFYHGFPPMRRGTWRWTINVQYAATAFGQ